MSLSRWKKLKILSYKRPSDTKNGGILIGLHGINQR